MNVTNLTAEMSRYGYPAATFDEMTLTISGRTVVTSSIIWDAEYGAFRVIGWYAKKDGTRGAQVAKPIAFASELPESIVTALRAVRA